MNKKERVITKRKCITSANILYVEAGTNCPQGGDGGHGGMTYFMLEDDAGQGLDVKVNGAEGFDSCGKIEVIVRGDTECRTLIEALRFAADTLEEQSKERIDDVELRILGES